MVVEVENLDGDIKAESLQKKMVESLSEAGFKVELTSDHYYSDGIGIRCC